MGKFNRLLTELQVVIAPGEFVIITKKDYYVCSNAVAVVVTVLVMSSTFLAGAIFGAIQFG